MVSIQLTVVLMQPRTLKQARHARNWTLDELSAKTGIDKSTLSRLERGLTQPMHHTAERIRQKLGRVRFEKASAA